MTRMLRIVTLASLSVLVGSCGGNSTLDNTEAAVFLTVNLDTYNPETDVCAGDGLDMTIDNMTITSTPKDPELETTSNQDVSLTRWVMTPYRTDGGNDASPQWTNDVLVYVEAGGSADLMNYRIYPAEYLNLTPLSNLFPENGGVDPETGLRNIRQSIQLQIFGRTVSGKAVSTIPVPIAFNFFCVSP